jgi:hypothetical protein
LTSYRTKYKQYDHHTGAVALTLYIGLSHGAESFEHLLLLKAPPIAACVLRCKT